MNWLLIVVIGILLFFTIYGWFRGVLRMAFSLVVVIALVLLLGRFLTNGISFLISFLIGVIVLHILSKVVGLFSKLPVIHGLDRFFGLLVGAFLGLVVVWLLFYFATLIPGTTVGKALLSQISSSPFLLWLFENNGLLLIVSKLFHDPKG